MNRSLKCGIEKGCDSVEYIWEESPDGYVSTRKEKVIRCKDCERRGNPKLCVIAYIAQKQDMPVFFYDNRGEWFCGDGKRKEG